jgi:hypothetical protein
VPSLSTTARCSPRFAGLGWRLRRGRKGGHEGHARTTAPPGGRSGGRPGPDRLRRRQPGHVRRRVGERVTAALGEPVTLNIDADTAGELHVHSTPEQEIEFARGVSTKMLTIDQPGVVDVEDHELEKVIVQLQVS